MIQAIAQRRPVLIHCLHVLEPTGDFVSLCFALCIWMCSTPVEPWSDCLRRGCQIFCLGPKLQERSAGVVTRSGHPRNLAVEYWRATTELYGALTPVDLRWLTESAASVESVALNSSISNSSSGHRSSSPPQLQQQQQDQEEEEHEEEQEEKQQEENEGE